MHESKAFKEHRFQVGIAFASELWAPEAGLRQQRL